MGKERIVILENNRKQAPKVADFNCCIQLSVNIESTNRAGFLGLRRKSAVNNPKYLRGGWKTKTGRNDGGTSRGPTKAKGYIRHGY